MKLITLFVVNFSICVAAQTVSIKNLGNVCELNWTPNPLVTHYRVEYQDILGYSGWLAAPLQDQWLIGSTRWTGIMTNQTRFFRVVSITMNRGQVISSNLLQTIPKSFLTAIFSANGIPITAQYDVKSYAVYYDTVTPDGLPTRASMAYVMPSGSSGPFPLVSYQHGTEFLTNKVASLKDGEYVLGLAFASVGYVVSMPDYLGMGSGSGMHPYVHSRSEATASIDAIRAARVLSQKFGVNLNGQLFLIGYSQGGQATMALHKEIEAYHTNEFSITASAPMAGPYDMSGTMANIMTSDQPYGSPEFLPYTLFSYNYVYKICNSPSEFLKEPYATNLPPLFNGKNSGSYISSMMPSVPSQIFKPEFLNEFKSNQNHPFRIVLRANDLYNWTPIAPMRMYHCHSDTTVFYANSEVALASFHNRGATNILLIDPYPQGTHSSGSSYCFLAAFQWFETLKL